MFRSIDPQRDAVAGIGTLLVLALICFGVLYFEKPPRAVPENVPPELFSAQRASRHLPALAAAPHPSATAENAEVRRYILRELENLGLEAEEQEVLVQYDWMFARVHNVLATLEGADSSSAILLVAHFDTTANTRGAGDNSMAVAALLETLRALREASQRRRNIIVLFSDGEELGHLGVIGFMENHPSAKTVAVALNVDASGPRGPVYLVDTSGKNLSLMRELRRALPSPRASSIATFLNKVEPMTSDFMELKARGYPGFFFAHAGSPTVMHNQADSLSRVDLNTLQHQGESLLAVAGHFADVELRESARDAVFFSVMGRWIVVYSQGTTVVLGLAAGVLMFAVARLGLRSRTLSARGILVGAALAGVLLALAPLLDILLTWLLSTRHEFYRQYLSGYTYRPEMRLICSAGICAGIYCGALGAISRRVAAVDLISGMFCLMTLAGLGASLLAPGLSYLFILPVLAGFAALGFQLRRSETTPVRPSTFLSLAGATVAILILVPPVGLYPFLETDSGPVILLLFAMLLVFLTPVLLKVLSPYRRALPSGFLLIGLLALVYLELRTEFDQEFPSTDFLVYGLDANRGTAIWAGAGSRFDVTEPMDDFLRSLLGDRAEIRPLEDFYVFRRKPDMYQAPAPVASLVAPEAVLLEDVEVEQARVLRFRLSSPRAAPSVVVQLEGDVLEGRVAGKSHDSLADTRMFGFVGIPPEGIEFEIRVAKGSLLKMAVVDQTLGFPRLTPAVPRRPPHLIAEPSGGLWVYSDSTMVRSEYTF